MRDLPHPAEHGQFVPGQGWYDANRRWWVSNPKAVSVTAKPLDPDSVDSVARADFERMQASARGAFKVNPQLEQLRKLADSDRPEERAKAEQLLSGGLRMHLGRYETDKRNHVATGGELPEGATTPPKEGE